MFYLTRGWAVPGKGAPPPPDRTTGGDYTYWGGPNYRTTESANFPKTFTGSQYLEVGVDAASTAFREPQTVHSPEHGAIAGYSVGGSEAAIPVRSGDLRWEGLPTGFTQVSGFLVGHGMTARIEAGAASDDRLQVGYFRGDPIEVQMEYEGADGSWHPYQTAEFTYKSNWAHHFLVADPDWQTEGFHFSSYLVDPRTSRFGGLATVLAGGLKIKSWTTLDPAMTWPEGASLAFGTLRSEGVRPGWTGPAANTGWNFNGNVDYITPYNPAGIVENNKVAWGESNTFAYRDPDDVMRPGMAGSNEYGSGAGGNPMSRRAVISSTGKLTVSADSLAGRPRILNRPFRSVAEIGHSFRGTPWRNIDLLNPSSPDSGLLDVLSLYENPTETAEDAAKPQVVAGRVNLNQAGVEVIAALLRGAALDEKSYLSDTQAKEMATEVRRWVHSTSAGEGPLGSLGGLVGTSVPNESAKGLVQQLSGRLSSAKDRSINERREFAVRALSGGTTVRAWDFMLDLVVQTGQLTGSSGLQQFNASGERRYWIHFAIDRPTGRILDVQWEPVTE